MMEKSLINSYLWTSDLLCNIHSFVRGNNGVETNLISLQVQINKIKYIK